VVTAVVAFGHCNGKGRQQLLDNKQVARERTSNAVRARKKISEKLPAGWTYLFFLLSEREPRNMCGAWSNTAFFCESACTSIGLDNASSNQSGRQFVE
jgi:hypothetical protein